MHSIAWGRILLTGKHKSVSSASLTDINSVTYLISIYDFSTVILNTEFSVTFNNSLYKIHSGNLLINIPQPHTKKEIE